jgi:proline dehydrogenase
MQTDLSTFDTAPPKESLLKTLKAGTIRMISASVLPVLSRVAPNHVGGQTIEDAVRVAQRLSHEKTPSTLGFWDTADYSQRQVVDIYLATIRQLAGSGLDSYVSVKPPALRFATGAARELAAAASEADLRLHFDSHGPEAVERSHAMLQSMIDEVGADGLGTTIPGRWQRSLSDAGWAAERALNFRVVKGQWPDPCDPDRDMRAGFLAVIDQLAGRVPHVAVATHDLPLAEEAVRRLRSAGASFELEQILGMTTPQSLAWARQNNVKVRIYIPFGKGYIPNALGVLKRNPWLVWKLIKDMAAQRYLNRRAGNSLIAP